MGAGSVSWLEWTQQLQAYVAWVNSQLRKRPGVRPVTDLRTDLQSGEILAQLIEIICKFFAALLHAYFIKSCKIQSLCIYITYVEDRGVPYLVWQYL
jgi:hypothetical protein